MSGVVQMTYLPADPRLPHVEVMTFDDLRRMNCGVTQRCDFLVLAFVTDGAGSVAVDFERHELAPGSLVWVAPGAVHRWVEFADLHGRLVLCQPTSPLTTSTRAAVITPRADPVTNPSAEVWRYLTAALDHLALEVGPEGIETSNPDLQAALITAPLARIPAGEDGRHADDGFERFRSSVEAGFRGNRDVTHYARALGYAERTLTRKAIAATGETAKAFIEKRVVLEAKRLMVHHRLTAAACATELGFADPSAFSAFFRRVAGQPPGAWKDAHSPD